MRTGLFLCFIEKNRARESSQANITISVHKQTAVCVDELKNGALRRISLSRRRIHRALSFWIPKQIPCQSQSGNVAPQARLSGDSFLTVKSPVVAPVEAGGEHQTSQSQITSKPPCVSTN